MKFKEITAVFAVCIWISISEFFRNSFLLREYWIGYYKKLGLVFPEQPVNASLWGIWAFLFSVVLLVIHKKFSFAESIILGWIIGFPMMWLVIGNLGVLPLETLFFAIPLSFVETAVAIYIFNKMVR